MTNTTTNYSYNTIPGNVEEAATDPGENHNTQKDENIRMTKKVRVASGVLGFLCLAFFVVGRYNGHQSRTSVGTTAASSNIVSFNPNNLPPPPPTTPPGPTCSSTEECTIPTGLDHGVCRDGYCQSGASSSSCGVGSDCVAPQGLDHGVCRKGKCQRGVYKDYCGKDSDCVSNNCVGVTDMAKCKN